MAERNALVASIKTAAPGLFQQVNKLADRWLEPLIADAEARGPAQDKHINDPIWGTITLHPWEVALLDTELVQRLRGVKQLGLAHLVFPTATHDRFSHACGVVEAVERMMDHIVRNTKARIRSGRSEDAPPLISDGERYLVRLAALIHDVGHGPFSHAIEPVVDKIFKEELTALEKALREAIPRTDKVQVSEAVAVMVIASCAFQALLARPLMDAIRAGSSVTDATFGLIAAIIGGTDGTARGALGALVSSQVDADKLDYMARDAYHAGLPIDFDTERLISKLESIRIEDQVLSRRLSELKERTKKADGGRYQEIGISAGGTGAFEQMLVGRIFLYDRLYHHHKVRTADSMAQRLIYYADPEAKSLSLETLYASLPDDTVVRAFGGLKIKLGTEADPVVFPSTPASTEISKAIVSRRLYQRAFAFAGRFIAGLDDLVTDGDVPSDGRTEDEKDAERARVMTRVNTKLVDMDGRLAAEAEIAALAKTIGETLPEGHPLRKQAEGLSSHHIIVDLPRTPHPPRITTIARNDDGRLDVPDVFYDPARWATVYATQRRTGYVFGQPERRAIISVAARVWFLRKFGCVLGEVADRHAKCTKLITNDWYHDLERQGLITATERGYIERPRLVYLPVNLQDRHIPAEWREADPDFWDQFNRAFNEVLPEGVSALAENELVQTLRGLFRTMQTFALDSTFVTSTIENEKELQERLRQALRQVPLDIVEGSERAGGETDLVAFRRVLIENKVLKDPTDNPLEAIPKTGLQGRRYVLPTNQSFVVTVVAYRARTESGHLPPVQCVRVRQLEGVDAPFVEIRTAIRFGDKVPSRAG